jgi:hypothetical protein
MVPSYKIIHGIECKQDGAQNIQNGRRFIEWWYFDGILEKNLSFVLTFWTSSDGNSINIVFYDQDNDTRKNYNYIFPQNEIKISKDKCKIKMGNNYVLEQNGIYLIKIKERDLFFSIRLLPCVDGFGILTRHIFKSRTFWPWIVMVPRGEIRGIMRNDYGTTWIKGFGYHDHNYYPNMKNHNEVGDWYWGRFFTKIFTIVATQGFEKEGKSIFIMFKNNKLIKSEIGNNIIFNREEGKKINQNEIPNKVFFKVGHYSIIISNYGVSLKTNKFIRFVNKFSLKFLKNNKEYKESGNGLSEFVYRKEVLK